MGWFKETLREVRFARNTIWSAMSGKVWSSVCVLWGAKVFLRDTLSWVLCLHNIFWLNNPWFLYITWSFNICGMIFTFVLKHSSKVKLYNIFIKLLAFTHKYLTSYPEVVIQLFRFILLSWIRKSLVLALVLVLGFFSLGFHLMFVSCLLFE